MLSDSPVVQGRPEAGGPAQGVGGGLHPLVDPDLDEVGVGDVANTLRLWEFYVSLAWQGQTIAFWVGEQFVFDLCSVQ